MCSTSDIKPNRFLKTFLPSLIQRELRGRLRIWLAWITASLLAFWISVDPRLTGVLWILAGASLRMWASGCIEKESRLSQGGPFQWCRNPLYVGSLLITWGVFISQKMYFAGGVAVLFSLTVYHPLILAEEKVLLIKFGPAYEAYRNHVSRYIPSIRTLNTFLFNRAIKSEPDGHAESKPHTRMLGFDKNTFYRNRGWEPALVAIGIILTMWAIHETKDFSLRHLALLSFH